jgi:hypothetical protein
MNVIVSIKINTDELTINLKKDDIIENSMIVGIVSLIKNINFKKININCSIIDDIDININNVNIDNISKNIQNIINSIDDYLLYELQINCYHININFNNRLSNLKCLTINSSKILNIFKSTNFIEKKIINLPNNLKIFRLNCERFYNICTILPINLEELYIEDTYEGSLDELPPNLKILHINNCIQQKLDNLPNTLIEISIPVFDTRINMLPDSIETIIFVYFDIRCKCNISEIKLPKNIKKVIFKKKYYREYDEDSFKIIKYQETKLKKMLLDNNITYKNEY